MLTEKQQEIVDDIMDNFDFDKVHNVMVELDWGWGDSDGNLSIPEIWELKKSARRLLKESMEEGLCVATGGFQVDKDGDYISLKFIVEEWDNYD